MNTEIVRADPAAPGSAGLARDGHLPMDFPILVDADTREIVEPVLLFIADRYMGCMNSAKSAANDLKDWWAFLSEIKRPWYAASREDVEFYRDAMFQTVSPVTHRPYADTTVIKRTGTVMTFYTWAHAKGLIDQALDRRISKPISRQSNADSLAHVRRSSTFESNDILPKRRTGLDDQVVALTPNDVEIVFKTLGPLPSEKATDARPSRDRLIAETGLNTGMRRDELRSLLKWQIYGLRPESSISTSVCALPLTKTKGLRPRKVLVPIWLVEDLIHYIENERAEAIKAARFYNRMPRNHEPTELFVNGISSCYNTGFGISNDTIDRQFRAAILAAGLTKTVSLVDPTTNERYVVEEVRYVFHALRHTFAIWRYYAEFMNGAREPWKIVQALLGHQSLQTTMAIYLRPCAIFEAQVSDVVLRYFEDIRNG